jgi:hypothetical protein
VGHSENHNNKNYSHNHNHIHNTIIIIANHAYPTLFSPLTLSNGMVLPNRVLMGSMHTGLEGHSIPPWFQRYVLGVPHPHVTTTLDEMAVYFAERARGGVGLMVTGGIAPNRQGWTGPFAAKLSTSQEMEWHKVVTQAVHEVLIPTTTMVVDPSQRVVVLVPQQYHQQYHHHHGRDG